MRFLRQLAPCKGRIEFTCVWDRSFASGYSPPRFAATQFPLATRQARVAGGLRLALVGFMVSSAYVGRASRPPSRASSPEVNSSPRVGPPAPEKFEAGKMPAGAGGTPALPGAKALRAAKDAAPPRMARR